jgi:hypothetical protein
MVTLRVRVDAEHAQLNRRLNPQVCGCGAAGFTCALHFIELGVLRENLVCVDVLGVVYAGRDDLVSEPEKYGPTRSTHPPPPSSNCAFDYALRGKPCNSRAKLTGESLKAEAKRNAWRLVSSHCKTKTHTHTPTHNCTHVDTSTR